MWARAGAIVDAFGALRSEWREGEPCVFLDGEAAPGPAELHGRSFVATRPRATLCVRGDRAWWRDGAGEWQAIAGDPWDLLRKLATSAAWTAGIASYDAGRLIERIPARAAYSDELPWLLFFAFERVRTYGSGNGDGGGDGPRSTATATAKFSALRPAMARAQFERMVEKAKSYIRAGDIFQANLSHRIECDVRGSPLDVYARLRAVNPAPFSAFLSSGPLPWDPDGFCVLSSSPERLFSLRAGRLEARPIAGTRRRDADPTRDAALKAELRADEKERAEHVMLVDLARNDLGRVARFGSVRVPDLLTVESYRTVHHLVSVVEADLAPGKDAIDALVALFPGGTITGAPKVRAMEIIEELEPTRRGAYTGSLGWIGANGDADMNILIRTIVIARGKLSLQVGAGIVEESDPAREYEETLAKAKGLLMALGEEDPR